MLNRITTAFLLLILASAFAYIGGGLGAWLYETNRGIEYSTQQFLHGYGLVGYATLVFCAPSLLFVCVFGILKFQSIEKSCLYCIVSGFLLGLSLWLVSILIEPDGIGVGRLVLIPSGICFVVMLIVSIIITRGKSQNNRIERTP